MSEYIKREFAVSAIALETDMPLKQARKILEDVPSINVVRCPDCKYDYICAHEVVQKTIHGWRHCPVGYCEVGRREEQEDE